MWFVDWIILQKTTKMGRLACIVVLIAIGWAAADEAKDDKKDSVGTVIGIDLGTTYSWWVVNALFFI